MAEILNLFSQDFNFKPWLEVSCEIPREETQVKTRDKRKLAVALYGPDRGKPTVVLQGTPGSSLLATTLKPTEFIGLLGMLNRRLIIPDRRGYGKSDPLETDTVAREAEDIEDMVDKLDIDIETFDVVGRSAGGPRAWACAALMPDRITGVVTMGSPSPEQFNKGVAKVNAEFVKLSHEKRMLSREAVVRGIQADPNYFFNVFLRGSLTQYEQQVTNNGFFYNQFIKTVADGFRQGANGWHCDTVATYELPWGVTWDNIKKEIPKLIWHGREDTAVLPNHALTLKRLVPSAYLDLPENMAHFNAFQIFPSLLHRLNQMQNEDYEIFRA